jgi:hypothetical protein
MSSQHRLERTGWQQRCAMTANPPELVDVDVVYFLLAVARLVVMMMAFVPCCHWRELDRYK